MRLLIKLLNKQIWWFEIDDTHTSDQMFPLKPKKSFGSFSNRAGEHDHQALDKRVEFMQLPLQQKRDQPNSKFIFIYYMHFRHTDLTVCLFVNVIVVLLCR